MIKYEELKSTLHICFELPRLCGLRSTGLIKNLSKNLWSTEVILLWAKKLFLPTFVLTQSPVWAKKIYEKLCCMPLWCGYISETPAWQSGLCFASYLCWSTKSNPTLFRTKVHKGAAFFSNKCICLHCQDFILTLYSPAQSIPAICSLKCSI